MSERIMSKSPQPAHEPDDDIRAIVSAMLDKVAPDEVVMARYYHPEAVAARTELNAQLLADDWPALSRFRAANAALPSPPELVMIGDSLTEIWQLALPEMFGGRIVNRGISGQTSPQILLRFMADVVELSPRRVHVLCGGNDIAGNTGPNLPEDFLRHMRAMADLAAAHDIEMFIGSLTPAANVPWNPAARPLEWIPYLNGKLRELAYSRGLHFVDYFALLDDGRGGLPDRFSADGVHVTRSAYCEMTALLERQLGFPALSLTR